MAVIDNLYGHFSADCREFIITDPRTPRPWVNYMWNDRYVGLISHTGGGFSFVESPRDNRLTRLRYNSLPWDRPGRYVLVKDAATGEYRSLSWAPTIDKPYDRYECRHGQGYTRILTEFLQLRGEITYFVPRDREAEVWRVRLTNTSDRALRLEIYSFAELLLGNALNDLINQPNDKHFTDVRFDRDRQTLLATRRYWVLNKGVSVKQPNIDWPYRLLFTQTLPISGFDGSLDAFIGRWRSEANPLAVERGAMGNTEITAGDPIAALQSHIVLAARETVEFAVVMAIAPKDAPDPYAAVGWDSLTDLGALDRAFADLQAHWDRYLGAIRVATPDEQFNTMLNVWNPYQAAVTFDMARNAGYYHGGLLFGTGLRDRFQDILGVVIAEPERVRPRLLDALAFQFANGSTLHNYFKLTRTGEKTNHSDTPLWIPFGLMEYLNETADVAILDAVVPYYDGGEGTVREHLTRALDYAIANLGDRGLPKIYNGDWNDTLDHIGPQGKGETVWGAFFLGYVLQKTFPLWEHLGDRETLERYRTAYEALRSATQTHCWDGNWYLRAFRDNGIPLGSAKDAEGKIFLNAQSWAVISGLAPRDRADRALASCREQLLTPYGMQIVAPSFTQIDDTAGLISRCVPGKKENGAVFNHASSWFVLASVLHGDVETAWEVYRRMMPLNSARDGDRYEVEPYVYAEYVTSPDHPTQGQASHSWLTGTAVWMLRNGLDWLLGFQPALEGMRIDPHIPADWPEFRASRRFRGKTLHLHVRNPHGKHSGVRSLLVNGERLEGNLLDVDRFTADDLAIEVVLE